MDMEKVVVGPPGYGSPDPRTVAGRLVTLDEHPLAEEISEDYGSDVDAATVAEAMPEELRPKVSESDLGSMKKDELVELAESKGIDTEGMTKADLVEALSDESDADNGN